MYTVSQAARLTGVASTTLRAWERRYGVIAPRRTDGGYRLYDAHQIELLREMADVDPNVARQANLIFLVDRCDALAAPYYGDGSLLMHTNEIRARLQDFRDEFFAPELVDAFLKASRSEAFWLQLDFTHSITMSPASPTTIGAPKS